MMFGKNEYKYIAIEGNIGAGKTTFASEISKVTGARLLLERFEENPFLKDFYIDRDKFAFETEKFFLEDRIKHLMMHFENEPTYGTISDFSVFKSVIFANITLNARQQNDFNSFFEEKISLIKQPDLIIHLSNEPLEMKGRILKRGRAYEKNINENYLDEIEKAYESFWRAHPDLNVLLISSRQIQFPYKKQDIQSLIKYLEATEIKGIKCLDWNYLS
jgi:deoxyadenosine/deoxycytidine kinase